MGGAGIGAWVLVAPLLAGCLTSAPLPWPGAEPIAWQAEVMTSALPLLPLRVSARGELEGVATNLAAHAYCGRDDAPGFAPSYAGDDVLRYWYHEDNVDPEKPPWFLHRVGQPLRLEDLAPGQGALTRWRSDGAEGSSIILVWVLRADRPISIDPRLDRAATEAMLHGDLVAFNASSPWFCCVLKFGDSTLADRLGHGQRLFDTCHFPAFDPWSLVPARIPPCRMGGAHHEERVRCPEAGPAT